MNEILKQIGSLGIVPVIKIDDAKNAVPLAKALCNGGLPVAEVTFRTACAADAIRAITAELPDMLVGAGTVLTPAQVDEAVAAGSKFIVSPGLNPKVVARCLEIGIPVTPGCANPSDIETALEFGLDVVKFFPAEAAGGLPMIKAMSAPYGSLKFMPTGGINLDNLVSYLKFDKILACGGSFMVKDDLIKAGNFEKITELTHNAVMTMLGFEKGHVGINLPDADAAHELADTFEDMFGFAQDEHAGAIFSADAFEIMKKIHLGAHGHVGILTNSVERAMAYFERKGIHFNESTKGVDDKGRIKVIYFEKEYGGYAFHLTRKP